MAAVSIRRPIQSVASAALRKGSLFFGNICHRCETRLLLRPASLIQRRSVSVQWGDDRHLKGHQQKLVRKSKRQRLIDSHAQHRGDFAPGVPILEPEELKDIYASEVKFGPYLSIAPFFFSQRCSNS